MIYGYARVSTAEQELDVQLNELIAAGCQLENIFHEKITGTKLDRPKFQEVLSLLKEGDTLTVTKLDRFARSTIDAIKTVKDLFAKGIRIHILSMGMIENTPMGRMIFNIFSCFAEFERDLIVERTYAGKILARQDPNFHEGRPAVYKRAQKAHALELLKKHTYSEVEALTGMSKSTLIRIKRESMWRQQNG